MILFVFLALFAAGFNNLQSMHVSYSGSSYDSEVSIPKPRMIRDSMLARRLSIYLGAAGILGVGGLVALASANQGSSPERLFLTSGASLFAAVYFAQNRMEKQDNNDYRFIIKTYNQKFAGMKVRSEGRGLVIEQVIGLMKRVWVHLEQNLDKDKVKGGAARYLFENATRAIKILYYLLENVIKNQKDNEKTVLSSLKERFGFDISSTAIITDEESRAGLINTVTRNFWFYVRFNNEENRFKQNLLEVFKNRYDLWKFVNNPSGLKLGSDSEVVDYNPLLNYCEHVSVLLANAVQELDNLEKVEERYKSGSMQRSWALDRKDIILKGEILYGAVVKYLLGIEQEYSYPINDQAYGYREEAGRVSNQNAYQRVADFFENGK